jgi:hypothetical protein
MKIKASYIEEPDLIFGNQREEKDPKTGLKYFGPYFSPSEETPSPMQIRVGIIGNSITVALAKQILKLLGEEIKSNETNPWVFPDFPGFRLDNAIRCGFVSSDTWNATITDSEIKHILAISDINARIAAASDLFAEKIEKIALEDSPPHVIICALPKELEEYCGISERTRGAKRPKFTELEKAIEEMKREGQTFLSQWCLEVEVEVVEKSSRSYDFRNALKGKAMKFNIPTQILRETTARSILDYPESKGKIRQPPATFAWNLSTALYYKAHGRPWRLAKLTVGTCYVGISFYRSLLNPNQNLETAMAQVFTHSGEGFVLRGSDVTVDKQTREVHLTKSQSFDLLAHSIKKYSEKVNALPSRIVLHKTSSFSNEEIEGFNEAVGAIPKDYVTISENTDLRFLRTGKYPVLRGTLISLTQNQHLLYTTGYTPRVRTYPGPRIPKPLLVTHHGDSEIELICKEILGLTKLNWNTTAFSTESPITLEFARQVGRILSEASKDVVLRDHYRFYM